MLIRPYNASDLSAIKSLLIENLKYHELIDSLKLRKYLPGDETADYEKFLRRMESGQGYCLIVEGENKVIGFGYAYIWTSDAGTIKGHISKIFICQEHRGQGIGSEILSKLENHLTSQGCKSITLSVFAPNTEAHNLYKRKGYQDRFVEMVKFF